MKRFISTICVSAIAFTVMAESTYTFKARNSVKGVRSHKEAVSPRMMRALPSPSETVNHSVWCLFSSKSGMNSTTWSKLEKLGVEIVPFGRFDDLFVYQLLTRKSKGGHFAILKNDADFVNTLSMEPSDKIATELWTKQGLVYENEAEGILKISVEFVEGISAEKKIEVLSAVGAEPIYLDEELKEIQYVTASYEQVIVLAKASEVLLLSTYEQPEALNHEARELTGVNELQEDLYFNSWTNPNPGWLAHNKYTGNGISASINEHPRSGIRNDGMGYRHLDLAHEDMNDTIIRTDDAVVSRGSATAVNMPSLSDWYLTEHGTHVAGIVGGNGWKSKNDPDGAMRYRGVAPKATIYHHGDKGHTNNHSFTGHNSSDWYARHNDLSSEKYGRVGVFSAGNFQQKYKTYAAGYYSLSQSHKNGIIVGAGYKDRKILAPFSSCGPNSAGMIKPDVVAPGAGNYSTIPGGSMPTPKFTGGEFEIDSIALVNNGIKINWGFNSDEELWDNGHPKGGTAHHMTITRDGGVMKLDAQHDGYFFSPRFNNITAHENDTLVIRWRSAANHRVPLTWRWVRPTDNFAYGENEGYPYFVLTAEQLGSGWTETRIALGDDEDWTPGQSLSNLGAWIGLTVFDNGVMSCSKDGDYHGSSGTSMSGPFVTGVTALMLEKFKNTILAKHNEENGTTDDLRTFPMWNSSARAALIHTAEDMIDLVGISPGYNEDTGEPVIYDKGPDWATGWGYVNAKKAVDYVNANNMIQSTLSQNETVEYYMNWDGSEDFRVTLAWDDPSSSRSLINDLDMYLEHVATGTIARPWVLDETPMLPAEPQSGTISEAVVRANPATKGVDNVNTVEVVDVENPQSGLWKIVITGSAIASDQNTVEAGINQDFSLITDVPVGLSSGAHNTGSNYTLAEVLDFTAVNGWRVVSSGTTLEPVFEKQGEYLSPNMLLTGSGWSQIASNKDVDLFVGQDVANIRVGLHIAFPEDPAGVYRGNVQLLLNGNWCGQFEINSYGKSVVLDKSTGMWNAYYEFLLPNTAVTKLCDSPTEMKLTFGSLKFPGEMLLKKLEFEATDGEENRNIWTELDRIAQEHNYENTSSVIKSKAQDYDNRDWTNPPLYRVYYREMVDPVDNVNKRFYFQIRQDVDAEMQYVEWWAFEYGYAPEVPWASTSYWRQCWKYLGNEVIY